MTKKPELVVAVPEDEGGVSGRQGVPEGVLARALLAGTVAMLPVPLLDDLAVAGVRRRLVSSLAGARGVDLDRPALEALAAAPAQGRAGGLAGTAVRLGVRATSSRLMPAFLLARAAEAAVATFRLGVAFDAYALHHHVGGRLGLADAARLHAAIHADPATVGPLFRAFSATLRGGLRVAGETPGRLARALGRRKSEVVDFAPGLVESAQSALESELGRTLAAEARAIEDRLERALGARR